MARKFCGNHLERCRKAKGWSRFKLSAETDFRISAQSIFRYERQLRIPSVNNAILLVKALGVSLKELTDADS